MEVLAFLPFLLLALVFFDYSRKFFPNLHRRGGKTINPTTTYKLVLLSDNVNWPPQRFSRAEVSSVSPLLTLETSA